MTWSVSPTARRWLAAGGILGPVVFIGTWSVLGARRAGYSPIADPISRLAAVHAESRVPMTAGFIAFAGGVGLYGIALYPWLPAGAAAAATTAAATLAVAALPLDSTFGDQPHGVAAGVAYAALAAMPVLGGQSLARQGRGRAALASRALGLASGSALLASILSSHGTGLLQRVGLTLGDAWIIATAASVGRGSATGNRAEHGDVFEVAAEDAR